MEYDLSERVLKLAPSGIRAFFDLVLTMDDVISLGVGEPDFVTPWVIREKSVSSLEKGYTSYTSNKGMPELRKAINDSIERQYGLTYDSEEEILITVGVSEGLDLAIRAIVNPGDKILVPEPIYVSYAPVVELAGGVAVRIPTNIETGFKLTPELLASYIDPNVKAIMFNYPCNPTGTSYQRLELEAIAEVVKKYNLLVISDEVYDELTYDFDHTPFAMIDGMKPHVIYLNGFSKVYAMTGFRIGWACGPQEVIAAMTKIHQYTILCAPITGQIAAIEALKSASKSVQKMKIEYNRRRRFIVHALNEIGLDCHLPQGAFYVFPSIKKTGLSSMNFATSLLESQKVALVPGVAFGEGAEGFVRISYASSYDNLKEAVKRIALFLKEQKTLVI